VLVPVRRTVHDELAAAYRRDGLWDDTTVGEAVADGLRRYRDMPVRVWSEARPFRGTLADVGDLAGRLASGLAARGIGVGDVVSFQLPNWAEAAAAFYAGALLGAVVVPIVHIYGPKELAFILRQSGARAHITSSERAPTVDGIAPETTIVVGERAPAGMLRFDAVIDGPPTREPAAVDADEPAVLAYTSGTTADPKGVVHSHRTLLAELRHLNPLAPPLLGQLEPPPGSPPRLIMSPVGHVTGMLTGLLSPLRTGEAAHFMDRWDTEAALRAIAEGDLSCGGGATFFLISLLDHPGLTDAHLERMRYVSLGGAPIPAAVAERADAMGISLVRAYGSTEHPSVTACAHGDPREKRLYTDGHAFPRVEIRIVGSDGAECPPGMPGEIVTRGPDLFIGYTDASLTRARVDDEGWYTTGDVGVLDADGYLTITDRLTDVIIRGGENISAAEVEELLGRLDGVAEVAVVAAPDPRYGERGCAFIRPRPGGRAPDLEAVRAHLADAGLARQKWPEDVRIVDDFERTPSGKIKKYVLREALRR
jgi:acyl-CoA synthetase (AMP-forming)/AMP-acid ligase II